jgi:hypothetical protein
MKKLGSVLLLSCAVLTYAAGQTAQPAEKMAPPAAGSTQPSVKKLGAVTWDPNAHKLLWTVETGTMVNGEFVAASKDQYEISPDDAVMGAAGEKRGFDSDEAAELHQLLDVLSLYCAASVVWWDQGAGAPGETKPTGTDPDPAQKPVRVGQPSTPSPAAPVRIAPGVQVAHLQVVH